MESRGKCQRYMGISFFCALKTAQTGNQSERRQTVKVAKQSQYSDKSHANHLKDSHDAWRIADYGKARLLVPMLRLLP